MEKRIHKKIINWILEDRVDLINFDLDAGADRVLIEAREGGKDIGIYDGAGNVKEDELEALCKT